MNKFEYKNLTPFKWFILENFPFIEADFDALTEWQLFCKIGKEINKIINSKNTIGTQMETITNEFIILQNYVNNYFDNLDVQEEINNKLNEMADDGTLQEIISEYLNSLAIFGFNTLNDLKNATNLINGSFTKTLGYYSINDGGGALYKIRNITNNDIVDNGSIISLNNENLIAELVPENYISVKQFGAKGDYEVDDTEAIQKAINFASKVNRKVYINKGIYKVTQSIIIPFNSIIEGENMRKSIIKATLLDGFILINGNQYDYQKRDTIIRNLYIESTNNSDGIYTYSGITLERVYLIRVARAFEKNYGYCDFIKLDNVYACYCSPSDDNGVIYLQGDGDGYNLNQLNITNDDLSKYSIVAYRTRNLSINNSLIGSPLYIKECNAIIENVHMENYENFIKIENSTVTMNNLYKWKRLDGKDFILNGSYNVRNKLILNNLNLDYYPTQENYVSNPSEIFEYDDYSDISFDNINYTFSTYKIDNRTNQHIPFALNFVNDSPLNYINCQSIKENGFNWKRKTHGGSVYFTNFNTLPFKGEADNYDILIYISPVRTKGVCDYRIPIENRNISNALYVQIQRNQCGFAHIFYKKHSESAYTKYCLVPLITPTLYFDGVAFNGVSPTDVNYTDDVQWTQIDGVVSATYRTFSSDNNPPASGDFINGDIWIDNGFAYIRQSNTWKQLTTN